MHRYRFFEKYRKTEVTTLYATEQLGLNPDTPVEQKVWTHQEKFSEVHGGRKLHWGARRTWQALNKRFPGYVEPVYRHLKKAHSRGAVGVDLLTVTPVDEAGNVGCFCYYCC